MLRLLSRSLPLLSDCAPNECTESANSRSQWQNNVLHHSKRLLVMLLPPLTLFLSPSLPSVFFPILPHSQNRPLPLNHSYPSVTNPLQYFPRPLPPRTSTLVYQFPPFCTPTTPSLSLLIVVLFPFLKHLSSFRPSILLHFCPASFYCSYDRSCSRHQPPLSRGGPPPLSLALPRSLASEDSRQTLHSTSSSFADRER